MDFLLVTWTSIQNVRCLLQEGGGDMKNKVLTPKWDYTYTLAEILHISDRFQTKTMAIQFFSNEDIFIWLDELDKLDKITHSLIRTHLQFHINTENILVWWLGWLTAKQATCKFYFVEFTDIHRFSNRKRVLTMYTVGKSVNITDISKKTGQIPTLLSSP